jgi:hypothetical protein
VEARLGRDFHKALKRAAVAFAKYENLRTVAQRIKKTEAGPFEIAAERQKFERTIDARETVKIGHS